MAAQRALGQPYWVIEPLVDAGLALDEIRTLVFDLGFAAIVSEGGGGVSDVLDVVRDRPVEVRLAWLSVIGRMLDMEPTDGPPRGADG